MVDAHDDTGIHVARAKERRDAFVDNALGIGIGEGALEALSDLDTNLALVRRDEQQDAIVALLAAELPGIRDPDRGLFDREPR